MKRWTVCLCGLHANRTPALPPVFMTAHLGVVPALASVHEQPEKTLPLHHLLCGSYGRSHTLFAQLEAVSREKPSGD
jgi:hypothetical protein